jgi:hypothetical protein
LPIAARIETAHSNEQKRLRRFIGEACPANGRHSDPERSEGEESMQACQTHKSVSLF